MSIILKVATRILNANPKGSIRALAELTAKKVYADLDGMSPYARKLVIATATSAVKQARYKRRTQNYAAGAQGAPLSVEEAA